MIDGHLKRSRRQGTSLRRPALLHSGNGNVAVRVHGAFVKLELVSARSNDSPVATRVDSANRLRGQRTADCFFSRAPPGLAFDLITSAPSPPSRVTLSTFLITPRIRSCLPPLLSSALLSVTLLCPCSFSLSLALFLSRARTRREKKSAHVYPPLSPRTSPLRNPQAG